MENNISTLLLILLVAMSFRDTVAVVTNARETFLSFDETRVDDLGWTNAHHIAYGRTFPALTDRDARDFLETASDTYLCVQNDFGQTALHLAVRQENIDVVKLYINRNLPCINTGNKDGDTPLHYAAYWGRVECTRLLLEGGANPEQQNGKGGTPLDDAREAGNGDVITFTGDQRGSIEL